MNKDIYAFLELLGDIEGNYVDSALQPWKQRGEEHKIYHLGRKVACLALIAMLGFCLAFHDQVYAAIKRFTTMISEGFWIKKDLSAYTEIIGQTQTKNGVALSLNEVILDDYKLLMAFHVDPMEHENDLSVRFDSDRTRINGKRCWVSSGSVGPVGDWGFSLEGSSKAQDFVLEEGYDGLDLPEGETKLHLVIMVDEEKPQSQGETDTLAEFVYDFTITPEELRAQTVKKDLDFSISAEDGRQLILKDLTMNDLYCRIVASGSLCEDEWENDYELKLKGEDSFGNPVSLFGRTYISEHELLFETDLWGDYEAGMSVAEDEFQSSAPDKNCAYMDLQLYKRKIIWQEESTEDLDDGYAVREAIGGIPGENDTLAEDGYAEFWSDIEDFSEIYSEENHYGWEPVGEKFRVMIK